MAAVTQTGSPYRHVTGDLVQRTYNISGSSGDYLDTGMQQVQFVDVQKSTNNATPAASTITSFTQTQVNQQTRITFTSSAPMTNEIVQVQARVG